MYPRILAVVTLLLGTTALRAQDPIQIDMEGTLVGVSGSIIAIKDNMGRTFQGEITTRLARPDGKFLIIPALTVNVTGTESAANLAPGMQIQFEALMTGKKNVIADVTKLTIITPPPGSPMGIIASEPAEAPMEAEEKEGKKAAARPTNVERCTVVGTITKAKAGSVTVTFPGTKGVVNETFKVAANAEILVSASSLSAAGIGDKVKVKGFSYRLPHFAITELTIEHVPAVDEKVAKQKLAEEMRAAAKAEKANKGDKGDKKKGPEAFGVGDPEEKKPEPVAEAKPKVKLQVLKVN